MVATSVVVVAVAVAAAAAAAVAVVVVNRAAATGSSVGDGVVVVMVGVWRLELVLVMMLMLVLVLVHDARYTDDALIPGADGGFHDESLALGGQHTVRDYVVARMGENHLLWGGWEGTKGKE